jgi:hypothetical protein
MEGKETDAIQTTGHQSSAVHWFILCSQQIASNKEIAIDTGRVNQE